MTDKQLDNLIKMIDQILANNLHHGEEDKITDVAADHLKKFWARSMKQRVIEYAHSDQAELSPLARATIEKLEELAQPR